MTMLNLDQEAARAAQAMVAAALTTAKKDAKAIENLINKALGVLQEQGVYACMLLLFSRTGDEKAYAEKIRPELYRLLGKLPALTGHAELPSDRDDARKVLAFYADQVCEKLDTLLLVRDLYEQALVYARFTAKAERKGG